MKKSIFIGMLSIVMISDYALGMQRLGIQGLQTALPGVMATVSSSSVGQSIRHFTTTSMLFKSWNHEQRPEEILGVSAKASMDEVNKSFTKMAREHRPVTDFDHRRFAMAQEAVEFFEKQNQSSSNNFSFSQSQSSYNTYHIDKKRIEEILKYGIRHDVASMGRDKCGFIADTFHLRRVLKELKELFGLLHVDHNDPVVLKYTLLKEFPELDETIEKYFNQIEYIRSYKKSERYHFLGIAAMCAGVTALVVKYPPSEEGKNTYKRRYR